MSGLGRRQKISTTISPESYKYLRHLMHTGRADTLAHAVDYAVARVRRAENRRRLEDDTTSYFERLHAERSQGQTASRATRKEQSAAAEEASLEAALGSLVDEVNLEE